MDQQSVRAVVAAAVERLLASQPDIFRLMPESAQTEWNLTHHRASAGPAWLVGNGR
jgi:hypothetical protein